MKPGTIAAPTFTPANVQKSTGRTLDQWFADLENAGGVDLGRRGLVQHLYSERKLDEWWSTTIVVEFERAKKVHEKDGLPKGYSICVTKTIAAPLERVFAAFGDGRDLERWFGPSATASMKDGGTLASGDGERCTFTRVRPGKDLRFGWEQGALAKGSQVEVLFASKGAGKTGITLNHTRIQDRHHADELRSAWGSAFEALKAHLEKVS